LNGKTLLSAEVPITTLDGKDPRGYFLRSGQADTLKVKQAVWALCWTGPTSCPVGLSECEPKGYLPRWTPWKRSSSPRSWRSKWWL